MSLLLPGKQTSASESLLHQAELLYAGLPPESRIPQAWLRARELTTNISFGRFVLMLDVLYALGLLELRPGDELLKAGTDAA